MDLGSDATDWDWVEQVLPRDHVKRFYLVPTNLEGERLRKIADQKFEFWGQDSKWRRWKTMTIRRFYAFWVAKLIMKVYGWNIESFFSRTSFSNISRKGQPLYGWTREILTICITLLYDRTHQMIRLKTFLYLTPSRTPFLARKQH